MSFLGPISMSLWAWMAVGATVLAISAYVIKMRRRRFEVPFSQLWRRVLDQKDANSLWKQLKRVMSLLLILLILGLVLFAALDPTVGSVSNDARNVVILLDASASMKATDGDDAGRDKTRTRLDVAKQKAKALIDGMSGGDVAMIMKVDGQATPMSRFTNDAPALDKIVSTMQASDTPADLTRALGAAADALRDRPQPLIVLISDGAYPEAQLDLVTWDHAAPGAAKNLAAVDLTGIETTYIPVGKRSDNVGIIAFNVRRYLANKASYEVYIEAQNFGTAPAHRKLTLSNGDGIVSTATLDFAPGERKHQIYKQLPGGENNRLRASLQPVDGPGGSDPFALDDSANALLPAHKKQKVLMVTDDNLYLEGALLVYDNIDPSKVTPAEYAAKPSVADGMDCVIFDDYTPEVLPPPSAGVILFHPTGEHSPFAIIGEAQKPHITELDEAHPVMKYITLSDVNFDRSEIFAADASKAETTLAYSIRDPIIVAKRDGVRKMIAFGFSLPANGRAGVTDLVLRVAFPMILVNALDWFAGDGADLLTTYPTGQRERIPLDGAVGASEVEVKGPDGTVTRAPVIDGLATFYGSRVGFYDLDVKGAGGQTLAQLALAANLASPAESDITPRPTLVLGGKTDEHGVVQGGKALGAPPKFKKSVALRIWLYIILFAAGLMIVEWVTYHRRITV